MNRTEFNKDTLIKVWDLSIKNMTPDVAHEVSETPLISSYSVQLPSFLEEPILCVIQIFKLQGDKPKISIIVGSYIEFSSFDITDDEFLELSQKFLQKNDDIEFEIRTNLVEKAEKNLELLIKSI
jgi:hypothetical protein